MSNKDQEQLVKLMTVAIATSPTAFMYMLDKSIKDARVGGASIDQVQRYYIKCLLDSNGTVLTEPVNFKSF